MLWHPSHKAALAALTLLPTLSRCYDDGHKTFPRATEGKGFLSVPVDTIDRPVGASLRARDAYEVQLNNMDFFYAMQSTSLAAAALHSNSETSNSLNTNPFHSPRPSSLHQDSNSPKRQPRSPIFSPKLTHRRHSLDRHPAAGRHRPRRHGLLGALGQPELPNGALAPAGHPMRQLRPVHPRPFEQPDGRPLRR
jgi:hypothetical protein